MRDETCIDFLQWCLPQLDKRWDGFRKVRGQVCKRITRRMHAVGVRGAAAYRSYLEDHPEEWEVLDALCRITISRFYRDRGVFDMIADPVLPDLARRALERGGDAVRCWSAGCASGEEAYTLTIIWRHVLEDRFPSLSLCCVGTDAQEHMLRRARRACYEDGTLKELSGAWREHAFTAQGEGEYCLHPSYRRGVTWEKQDIRREMPEGRFSLILCRNLVFTYFSRRLQKRCLQRMKAHLHPQGVLVLGKHETLPEDEAFTPWDEHRCIYRYRGG